LTDEKPLFEPDKIPKPIPDFKAMPFEELMTTECKDDNDKFNQALWTEQSERFEQLGIADAELLRQVDTYQDEITERLIKLEDKFTRLLKLLDNKTGIHSPDSPLTITIQQYVEGEIK